MCRAANFTAREREAREEMRRSADRTIGGKCSGWIEIGIIKKIVSPFERYEVVLVHDLSRGGKFIESFRMD